MIQLINPIAIYAIWLVVSTILLLASIGIGILYYYILMFKQINAKFYMIYDQSKLFFNMRNQGKLI